MDPRHRQGSERPLGAQGAAQETSALAARVSEAWSNWRTLEQTSSALEEAGLSEELEVEVVGLEAEARRLLEVERTGGDVGASALTDEVVASLRELRAVLDEQRGNRGPSIARLREVTSAMKAHAARDQHALALEAMTPVAPDLDWLAKDKDRAPYVEALRSAAERSQAVIDFDAMGYHPRGVVVLGDRAAALVGARAVVAGDRIMDEILVRSVTSHEVVFEFRGVVIKRRVLLHSPETWVR